MEANRIRKVSTDTAASGRACIAQITEDPKYELLRTKLYLGTDNQYPLEMLTDRSFPTQAEIKQIYGLHNEVQQCRKLILEGAAKIHPLVLANMVEAYSESDKVTVEAVGGRLSWGEINQRKKDIATRAQTNMADADVQISSQLQNQHQFELEQRQRAAAAFQQWNYQQQLIHAVNRPMTTNCNYIGSTVSCNSF